jgi:hypothetical protein
MRQVTRNDAVRTCLRIATTYQTKFVDATPTDTAPFTMMRGRLITEARAVAGKYSDRITPSHGKNTPMTSSRARNEARHTVKEAPFSSATRQGTRSSAAETR